MLFRVAIYLASGAASAMLVSNAACQILLGAALLALLLSGARLRFPPVALPLGLFVLGTLVALALSPNPHAGLPQIKKFYVYLMLPVVYTALRGAEDVIRVLLIQALLASVSGAWSLVQFWHKRSEALLRGWDFYSHYVSSRATGFMSHWMTFSAEQMMAGLVVIAFLLFGGSRVRRLWLALALVVMTAAMMVAWTRSVWLAAAAGTVYLVAVWRPKLLLLTPIAAAMMWLVAPTGVRERVVSIYQPHGQTDSNEHRRVTFLTGIEMVKAHPWFGLGPDMQKLEFDKYVPAYIQRPLPEGFYGHLHNVYLQYAADRGIPTMLALLWFIGKALNDFRRYLSELAAEDHARRAILHGAIAVIIGILFEAMFEYNLGDSEVLTMFLVIVACGYIVGGKEHVHV